MPALRNRDAQVRAGLFDIDEIMKLLANENFPSVAVDAMRDAGHDVLWARTDTPGATEGRTAAGSLTPGSSLRGQPGALIFKALGVGPGFPCVGRLDVFRKIGRTRFPSWFVC